MSYAPKSMLALQTYWKAQGGVSLGIVGNAAHTYGYHLGKDRIYSSSGKGANDYSVRLARDKAGLTNGVTGFDIGKLDGSLTSMYRFSRWLADKCRARTPGYRDVREVIFWDPATGKVRGWSALKPDVFIDNYGDASHKTHTHMSFFRDSEGRDKTSMFKPFFETKPVPVPPVEADVPKMSAYLPGHAAVLKPTSNIRTAPLVNATVIRTITNQEVWTIAGRTKGGVDPEGGSDQWYCRWFNNRWEYTAFSNVTSVSPPPSRTALAAAEAKVVAAEKALATSKTSLAACNKKVTDAKAALA